MDANELRALQAPLKTQYREDPARAVKLLRASGTLDQARVALTLDQASAPMLGLHPATGGDGSFGCAAELLLQAVVGCAGVTCCAVATAMSIAISGSIVAEGELDFRGTLGVDRDAPVGFVQIRLSFALKSDAKTEQLQKLVELSERYCVVLQTLKGVPLVSRLEAQT